MKEEDNKLKNKRISSSSMRYAGLATQWLVMLLIAVWAGYKIDALVKWRIPLFLILFPLISLSVSLWKLIKELNQTGK